MDEEHRIAFISVAATIGPPSLFRQEGGSLKDFLDNEVAPDDTPQAVGVKILGYFCMEFGKFNNFLPGVGLAIGFLDRVLDGPDDPMQRKQALKDLKALLDEASPAGLVQWVSTNYR